MSKPARRWSWLTAVAVAAAVVVGPAAARADDEYAPGPRTVEVGPGRFKNETTRVLSDQNVTFVLKDDVEYGHIIAFNHPPNPTAPTQYELDPANPAARSFTVTFAQAGVYDYRCTLHPHRGVVKVRDPLPATTTTAQPTTTSTARPVATPAGTDPKGVTAAGSTSQPGMAAAGSSAAPGVLVPAASKATSTTTAPPPTVPSPTVAAAPPAAPTATAAGAGDDPLELAGADSADVAFDDPVTREDSAVTDPTVVLVLAAGLAAALLGAAGWAWYHRPSRYQPA